MKKILLLVTLIAALPTSATAQACYDCKLDAGAPGGLSCQIVNGGESGVEICYMESDDVCVGDPPICYSCGFGECEQGRAHMGARARFARFTPQASAILSLDVAAIQAAAKKSPELAYAVATVAGYNMKFTEGQPKKLVWLPFAVDASHASLWLNPKSPAARAYFAVTREEGKAAARSGAEPVEVLLELNGNELTVTAIGGIGKGKARYLKLLLRDDQIVRGQKI